MRRYLVPGILALLAAVGVACASDDPTATPRATATPTAVPTSTSTPTSTPTPTPVPNAPVPELTVTMPPLGIQAMALTTADEGGFFDKQGVKVTLVPLGNAPEVMRAVRQGQADMALVPMIQVVMSLNSPRPLVAIGAIMGRTQLNVVVGGDIALRLGLTAASPLEDRLRGLEGLRLGHPPGPLGVNTAKAVVEAAGLSPEQDVELVPVRGEDQVSALAGGDINAFVGHHPYLEQAIVEEGAVLLLHLSGGGLPAWGTFPMQVLAIPAGESPPKGVSAVLAALGDAYKAIHEDPTVTAQALESAFPDLTGLLLEQGLRIYLPAVPTTPVITQEGFDTALKVFGLSAVAFDQVVDNSFIK